MRSRNPLRIIMLRSRTLRNAVVLTLGAVIGCTGGTEPARDTSPMAIVSGGAATGPALTIAPPIVVEIRDASGHPASGVPVVFSTVTAGEVDLARQSLFVCALGSDPCAQYTDQFRFNIRNGATVVTGPDGRASAAVQFGVLAGDATLTISVPSMGTSREITYTTVAGPLAQIVATHDTAVYAGVSYTLHARAADRIGNPRTDPVTSTSATPSVVTVSADNATAVATGRGRVVLRTGDIVDTAFVSVVPHGRLVALGRSSAGAPLNKFVLLDTDGSARRVVGEILPNDDNAAPVWTPEGAEIVFQTKAAADPFGTLAAIDTAGAQRLVFGNGGDFDLAREPAVAALSGRLFFYGRSRTTGITGVYSSKLDGSDTAFVAPGAVPGPAPDGQRVALGVDGALHVRDIATGTETVVATSAMMPAWSPDGANIAYLSSPLGSIRVVAADGSADRLLAQGFYASLSWSPDGKWLAASRYNGGVDIIDVANAVVLPVWTTTDLKQFAWRP